MLAFSRAGESGTSAVSQVRPGSFQAVARVASSWYLFFSQSRKAAVAAGPVSGS